MAPDMVRGPLHDNLSQDHKNLRNLDASNFLS